MPFLEITTAHASFQSFQNDICPFRPRTGFAGACISDNEKSFASSWKTLRLSGKSKNKNANKRRLEIRPDGLMIIKAVAILELTQSAQNTNEHEDCRNIFGPYNGDLPVVAHQALSDDSKELNEREKLRRMRISKANKGNTPWNKGRRHSPETLQRIRERTRLAMQDPKVKKKLANLGHAQSEETRIKIGAGVRMGWERRHGKQMQQETCYFEWQNLIAEVSRKGILGEEELQWDSYEILNKQLEQEWLASVEQRKNMPRPKGCKRAPKTLEQRRKIAEAITAKWADPVYRNKVYSGLAKYHGSQIRLERKPRKKTGGASTSRKSSPAKEKSDDIANLTTTGSKSQKLRTRLRRNDAPLYKDPLANSKLEMIKNIRAHRAAADIQKTEAIVRAKLLIVEAEKAAKALESAATKSHVALASLVETRKLIVEAIRSVELIEKGEANSYENGNCLPFASTELGGVDFNDTNPSSLLNFVDVGCSALNGFPLATRELGEADSDNSDWSTHLDSQDAGHYLDENNSSLPLKTKKLVNHLEKATDINIEDLSKLERKMVNNSTASNENIVNIEGLRQTERIANGTYASIENDDENLSLRHVVSGTSIVASRNISNQRFLGDNEKVYPSNSLDYNSASSVLDGMLNQQLTSAKKLSNLEPNWHSRNSKNMTQCESEPKFGDSETPIIATGMKKWVCGRLVDAVEGG